MFRAVKKPLQVEVTLNGSTVQVKPVYKNKSEGLLYRTMARCEEFLAQMFLQEQKGSYAGLKHYFQQRGWRVVETQGVS